MASIDDLKKEFDKLSKSFNDKITIQNAKNNIANNTTTVNENKLTKQYNRVISRLNELDDEYSTVFFKAQTDAIDTLIQTINYLLYTKSISATLNTYKKSAQLFNSIIGDNSEIMKLLKELEKLISLYVNLNAENCSYADDKDKFEALERKTKEYAEYKFNEEKYLEELSDFIDRLNTVIVTYDDTLALYNATVTEANKETPIDEVELLDVIEYAKYRANWKTTSSPNVLNSALTTYNANTHNKATPTSLYTMYAMYSKVQSKSDSNIPNNKYTYLSVNGSSTGIGPIAIVDYVNNSAVLSANGNLNNCTYFTYDSLNDIYTKAKFSSKIQKFYLDAGFNFKTYYNFNTNSDGTEIDYYFGGFKKVTDITFSANATYYDYDSETNSFVVNTDAYDTYRVMSELSSIVSAVPSSNDFSASNSTPYYNYIKYLQLMKIRSTEIADITKNIREKCELRDKINKLLATLKDLLKQYTGDSALLSLDTDEYDLTDEDGDGICDITIKESSKKIARSFSIKEFNDSRFYGYSGEVNRSGYVGQKANLYITKSLKKNSKTPRDKKLLLNAPLLHLSNITYSHNPKNIIFGLFNIRDYVGKIRIENEDEEQDEADGGYKLDDTYIRFGSIFSSKDIDLNASKQSIRLKCDSSSSWTSGKIYKKGIFELHNVNIIAKFNDEILGNRDDYDENTKFSDSVDVTIGVKDTGSGIEYVFRSKDGLKLAADYHEEHEDMAIEDENKIVTYFKGEMEIKSEEDLEKGDDPTSVNDASDYAATKDVVLKLTRLTEDLSSYRVEMFLDPDSSSNDTYYEDKGNDPKTYLPMFASNWVIEKAIRKRSVNTSNDAALEALSALLDLQNLFNSKDSIDALCPFDANRYANIISKFNNAKKAAMASLIASLSSINGIAKTATIANTVYQNYDPIFTNEYTSDLQQEFGKFTSKIAEVSQSDSSTFLSNSFINDLESYLVSIKSILYDNFSDITTILPYLNKYDKKLVLVAPSGRNKVDAASTLALFYDIVTGTSQTLQAMSSAGENIPTYSVYMSFVEWTNVYDILPNGLSESNNYLIENATQQLLYLLTQTYWLLEDNTEDNILNSCWSLHKQFLKYILLDLLKENTKNKYLKKVFLTSICDIIENYKTASDYIECELLNFNSYYLNPYIYQVFPQLEAYDRININDFVISDFTNGKIKLSSKALIYKAILESRREDITEKLYNLYSFFENLKKPNVREVFLLYGFCEVLKEIQQSSELTDRKYDVYKIPYNEVFVNNLANYVKYIIEYRTAVLSDEHPALAFMKCPTYQYDSTTAKYVEIMVNDATRRENIQKIGEINSTIITYKLGEVQGNETKVEKIEMSLIQLAQLLYNKYRILNGKQETRYMTSSSSSSSQTPQITESVYEVAETVYDTTVETTTTENINIGGTSGSDDYGGGGSNT